MLHLLATSAATAMLATAGGAIEGVVQDPGGQAVAQASVGYYLFLGDGSSSSGYTTTRQDGRFSIDDTQSDDLRAGTEVTRLICWAHRDANVSRPLDLKPGGTPVTLQLQPELPAARVRLEALAASGKGRHDQGLQVLLAPGVRRRVGLLGLGKGRALELEDVAPGPTVLTLLDPQGFQVTHQLQLQPGADHTIEVPFAVAVPPGKVGLILDESGAVIAVPPGAPAWQAGVRAGDVVTSVDGRRLENRNQAVEMLDGPPGTPVTVTVRRSAATSSFRIVRSTTGQPPPPKVKVRPPAKKAPGSIQPGPGERVLAEAAVVARPGGGPFRVEIDEAVGPSERLQVMLVDIPNRIPEDNPTRLTLTLEGPGDLREIQEVPYYNARLVRVGCDPVPGGGPDQCRNTTFWENAEPPEPIELGPQLLSTPGAYRLTIAVPGVGKVRRTFQVVPDQLSRAYRIHQQLQLGAYRIVARAAVELSFAGGARTLTVYRAVYRSGGKTLIADVSDSGPAWKELEGILAIDRWEKIPWVEGRNHRAIKLDRRPGAFEAAWSSDVLVRVAGGELGEAEQAVLDAYQANFPGYRQASP